jgi:hypothetical protein
MDKAVFAIARNEDQAIRIADQLKAAGFSGDDISVLFPDKAGSRDFAHEQHTKAPEGAAAGAGTGAVLGGALGWIVGIGALAIPGVGTLHRGGTDYGGAGRGGRGSGDRRHCRRPDRPGHTRVRG